jgi:ABC-type Fe3+/spermidine/putrescine transport system ATPase subunit
METEYSQETKKMKTYQFNLSVEIDAHDEEEALTIAKAMKIAAMNTGYITQIDIDKLERV